MRTRARYFFGLPGAVTGSAAPSADGRGGVRLRLACLWPILIGLETLLLLVRNVAWLDPARASKISRNDVYRLTALSLPVAGSNSVVRGWIGRLIARVEAQMH